MGPVMCGKCGRFKQTRCAHCDADAASAELTALRARLEAAERVVEAARGVSGKLRLLDCADSPVREARAWNALAKALAAYDAAKAGGGA